MIRRQWVLLFSAFVVATLFLALTSLGSAEAAPAAGHGYGYGPQGNHGLVGTISGITDATAPCSDTDFVLTLKRKGKGGVQSPVTIIVNAQTKFKVRGDKTITLANYCEKYANGNRVAVLGSGSGSTFTALHLNQIQGKGGSPPSFAHHVGTVTTLVCTGGASATCGAAPTPGGADPNDLTSITLTLKKGGTNTFLVPGTATLTLKKDASASLLNQRATLILKHDPVTDTFSVKQIVVFPPKP